MRYGLFTHAERREDVVEDIFGCDFAAGDFAEVVEARSEVFGNQVCGCLCSEGFLGAAEGFECLAEGVVVADICHDSVCIVEIGGQGYFLYQGVTE